MERRDDPFAAFNDHDPDTAEVVISGETVRKEASSG